jgi:hypothetical protein
MIDSSLKAHWRSFGSAFLLAQALHLGHSMNIDYPINFVVSIEKAAAPLQLDD